MKKIKFVQFLIDKRSWLTHFMPQIVFYIPYGFQGLQKDNQWYARKMKFSIEDFFTKCDEIVRKLRIWSDLLNGKLHFFVAKWVNNIINMFENRIMGCKIHRYHVIKRMMSCKAQYSKVWNFSHRFLLGPLYRRSYSCFVALNHENLQKLTNSNFEGWNLT